MGSRPLYYPLLAHPNTAAALDLNLMGKEIFSEQSKKTSVLIRQVKGTVTAYYHEVLPRTSNKVPRHWIFISRNQTRYTSSEEERFVSMGFFGSAN